MKTGDDGAVLVLWAVALTALMLFVAVAVDLGNLSQTVRLSQNSVDNAALLGAQELGTYGTTYATTMVGDVETQFSQNYPGPAWNWTRCTQLTGFTYVAGESCIGYATLSTGDITVSVSIPSNAPVNFSNFSQGSGGPKSAVVHTGAQASVQSPGGIAILPIGITSTAAQGGKFCVKGGNGNSSCPSTIAAGDQGLIVSPRYRTFAGTAENGAGNDDTSKVDIAVGLDHALQIYPYQPDGSHYFCDSDGGYGAANASKCAPGLLSNTSAPLYYDGASQVFALSGMTASTLEDGLLLGNFSAASTSAPTASCTFSARLQHPDGYSPQATCASADTINPDSPTATIDGNTLNARQISWYMLYGEGGQTPPAGGGAEFVVAYPLVSATAPKTAPVGDPTWTTADDAQLATDMKSDSALASPVQWFSSSISQSPRFAFVPVVSHCGGGSSGFCQIDGFEAAYIDQVFIQGGDVSFEAWIFNPKMIKNGPAPPGAGSGFFSGGPFVVNLCHEDLSGGTPTGNC